MKAYLQTSAALKEYIIGSWNNTESRVHDVRKVSMLQESPLILQIEGVTTYQRSNGKEQQGTWKAEQTYANQDGAQKICDYKINFASPQTLDVWFHSTTNNTSKTMLY